MSASPRATSSKAILTPTYEKLFDASATSVSAAIMLNTFPDELVARGFSALAIVGVCLGIAVAREKTLGRGDGVAVGA